MALLNRIAWAARKGHALPILKAFNGLVRKFSAKTHYVQHMAEWAYAPNPEWYDHFLDQHWAWFKTGNALSWERGFFSSLALKHNGNVLELCCGDGFNAYHFYAIHAGSIISVDFDSTAINHALKNFSNPKITYKVCDHMCPVNFYVVRYDNKL